MVIVPKYSNKEIDVPECPLIELSLFPIFQTREDYEKYMGEPCPPYNANLDKKNWFDPNPAPEYDEEYWIVYPCSSEVVIENGEVTRTRKLIVPKAQVGSVNIGTGLANEPGTGKYIQYPIRKLTENERFKVGTLNTVTVINTMLYNKPIDPQTAFRDILKELREIKEILMKSEKLLTEEEVLQEVKSRR